MKKPIIKQKTFWAGVALIVSGILAILKFPDNLIEGIGYIITGFGIIFGRQAIEGIKEHIKEN